MGSGNNPVVICPVETFPVLDALAGFRAVFVRRCPGVDVDADRETALARLWDHHRATAEAVGFGGMPMITAEQVHGNRCAVVDAGTDCPVRETDGLVTSAPRVCLAIYVADCAPVFLVDPRHSVIALVHAGKKGTGLGILGVALATMGARFGSLPGDIVMQIGPCIRPPHYEVDFAADLREQAVGAGVGEVHDCGNCTASEPENYYSYRREKGRTGRLLALLAMA